MRSWNCVLNGMTSAEIRQPPVDLKESLNKKENGQGKYFLLYQSEIARKKSQGIGLLVRSEEDVCLCSPCIDLHKEKKKSHVGSVA